jgi:hypothetical protein
MLLAKGDAPKESGGPHALPGQAIFSGGARVRCPRCGWVPRKEDRWYCFCGHTWNTFETFGRCPGCAHQWTQTQCLSCHQRSPHKDWYVEEPGASA